MVILFLFLLHYLNIFQIKKLAYHQTSLYRHNVYKVLVRLLRFQYLRYR
nr:MAG TPA: hypothetical protein [Caudoviricetes sp.]